jgi:hypothetical protein
MNSVAWEWLRAEGKVCAVLEAGEWVGGECQLGRGIVYEADGDICLARRREMGMVGHVYGLLCRGALSESGVVCHRADGPAHGPLPIGRALHGYCLLLHCLQFAVGDLDDDMFPSRLLVSGLSVPRAPLGHCPYLEQ